MDHTVIFKINFQTNVSSTGAVKSAVREEIKTPPRPIATVTKSAPKQNVAPTQEKQSPKKTFAPPPEGMVQCGICGRNFLEDRIAKHETICSKNATKKRKVFDSTKHRVQVIYILISCR